MQQSVAGGVGAKAYTRYWLSCSGNGRQCCHSQAARHLYESAMLLCCTQLERLFGVIAVDCLQGWAPGWHIT